MVTSIFLSFFFFSSPNLSGRRLDVYHISTHDVALVGIYNAGLKCASRSWLKIGLQGRKNSPSAHHRTTLSGYIFAIKACIDNQKVLNSNTSSTCPGNMVNFGTLAAEICWRVWGTPVIMVALCNIFTDLQPYIFAL